ncbi:thioredoxin domain-containing protein [Rhodococcus sp. X156]|uniref:thioredoxin domain-containing protein n=1 Tax=Rhodococcus sp. X156 TaxID=2499145 RepID=UPI000FDC78E7|nr:thioredoxin domain-containing protein [Rhodococcus sp. X156]
MNQLAESSSPYLLQHKDNPVHWQEWSAAALEEARQRDVPVLLSVGYSACHWCHVMAHESFENPEIAAQMNRDFVCVKVDREERPDIDAVYMEATVAMTGQGGWPMTCFLTPDAEPFHCGTYYPPTPRQGMPSFPQLLTAVTHAWTDNRAEVLKAGVAVVAELERASGVLPPAAVTQEALDSAVGKVLRDADPVNGGFGTAPKFPPTMLCQALLRHYERTGAEKALATVVRTADAMARGGINDQLGGGFARYSVDAAWVVPHFEKMLYDNAQLLRLYANLHRVTGSALALRTAQSTADLLLGALRTEQGGFASALDADTDGVEGLTYVWTPAQLAEVLGPDDGAWAAELLVVTEEGTFEHGASVLQLPVDPDDSDRWQRVRATLLAARARRPQPGRDDKVVTAWNGLAITALAEAGAALDRPEWVEAAATCAEHLLATHLVDGRLRRASLGGSVGSAAAVLEDHASLATGLLALHQATGALSWLEHGCTLVDLAVEHFADGTEPGAWFDTANDAEALVRRPRDPMDNVTPSGASAMAEALQVAAALTEPERSARYAELADTTLARAGVLLDRAPRAAGNWWAVAEAAQRGPLQVAVAGGGALLSSARRNAPGGTVIVGGKPDSAPLLAGRELIDGHPAAYVCRGFVCDRPVASVPELLQLLGRGADSV